MDYYFAKKNILLWKNAKSQ